MTGTVGRHKDANLIVRKRGRDNFSSRRKRIITPSISQVAGTYAFNAVLVLLPAALSLQRHCSGRERERGEREREEGEDMEWL